MNWIEIALLILQIIGGFTVLAAVILVCVAAYLRNGPSAFEPEDSDHELFDYQ